MRRLFASGVLVFVLLLPVVAGARGQASEAERLFNRAYKAYENEDFSRANVLFEQLVERFPETTRGKDAAYFLDRLNLHGHRSSLEPPEIEVLLSEAEELSGEVLTAVELRDGDGKLLQKLSPGQSWSVESTGERLNFTAGGESYERDRLGLVARKNGEVFQLDGISYRGRLSLIPGADAVKAVNRLRLNHYLYGVVQKETAPGWPLEMFKAQAVASRSMAVNAIVKGKNQELGYDFAPDQTFQKYEGYTAESKRARRAVEQTRGQVLLYRGQVVPAYFHSNSGGHVESGRHIWSGSGFDFIKPRPDTWSRETEYSTWQQTLKIDAVNRALEAAGFSPLALSPALKASEKLTSGRAVELQYTSADGTQVRVDANKFRLAVGAHRLRSTWFETIEAQSGELSFEGRGWGHGVGMSQWGAKAMTEAGHSYVEVLGFYYARTRLADNYGPAYRALRTMRNLIPE